MERAREGRRWLGELLATSLGYFAAGRLALLMAIPPGYATAVWPAAGIALAACMRWGPRVAPAVFVGSFAVNVGTGFDQSSAETVARSLGVASAIGIGAALQAVVGAGLVRRFVGPDPVLERELDIARFLVLGGPIGCIVGATWGVTTLLAAGTIAPGNYLFSWFTWWVGDAIGSLIFAPIALALAAGPRPGWRARRTTVALPLAIGFACVTLLFVRVSAWEHQRLEAEFVRSAAGIGNALEAQVTRSVDAVESLASVLEATPDLDANEFRAVTARLHDRVGTSTALGWNPRVDAAERLTFETGARARGVGELAIAELSRSGSLTAASPRPQYFPALFLEPSIDNHAAIGFDPGSDPVRAEALARARRTGLAAATAPVALVQQGQRGVLVAVPVFATPARATSSRPERSLLGYAIGVYRIDRLLQTTLTNVEHTGLEVRLADVTDALPIAITDAGARPSAWSRLLTIGGRTWRVGVARSDDAPIARSWAAWVVLAGGLAFLGSLGGVLLLVTGRAGRLAEAEARYRDLYDQSPDMYASVDAVDGTIVECNATVCRVLGYDRADVVGRSVFELYHSTSQAEARRLFASFAATGVVSGPALQLRHRDGSIVDVSLNATAVRSDSGAIVRSRSVWRDVTAIREVERDREFLLLLGETLSTLSDPVVALRETTARLVAYLRIDRAHYAEVDPTHVTVYVHPSTGPVPPPRRVETGAIAAAGLGTTLQGQIVAITDTRDDPLTASLHDSVYAPREIRALISVPLMRDGRCVGSLAAVSTAPRAWTPREIALVQAVAERSWLWHEHLRTSHALRRSEQHHRRIVETANEGIWEIDREGRTRFVNAQMAALLDHEPGAMLGRPVTDYVEAERRQLAEQALALREQRNTDVRLLRRDGTTVWTRIASAPLYGADGEYLGALAMVSDLSERVRMEDELRTLGRQLEDRVEQRTRALAESETRFRSLFADSPISLWEEDFSGVRAYLDELARSGVGDLARHLRDHPECVAIAAARVRVVSVNDATLEMFEAASEAQLFAGLPQLFGPEALEVFRDAIISLLSGQTRFAAETTVHTLSGRSRAIHLRLTVIPGNESTWNRIVVSNFDLSAHKEAERAVRAALREKEVLLKEVHHRVKNNLQVISSLLNLQAHHIGDRRLRGVFAETQARVQSIALVHERLYRSKDLARIPIDEYLHTLVEGLFHTHDTAARGIEHEIAVGGLQLPVDIAIPCGLVVNELVTNALKYAFPDGRSGRITVAARRVERTVELVVADDGVGLPAGLDVRATTTLGLDLVFTFADQLEAQVEVRRERGTAFVLSFAAPEQ